MSDDEFQPSEPIRSDFPSSKIAKGKEPARKRARRSDPLDTRIKITGKLFVEHIAVIDSIPSTWTVPRAPTVYSLDLSNVEATLKASGEVKSIDAYIRSEVCCYL